MRNSTKMFVSLLLLCGATNVSAKTDVNVAQSQRILAAVAEAEAYQVNWVPKEQGYSNAQVLETVKLDEKINAVFSKGTNNNLAPAYYDKGTAARLYGGNTLTISGGKVAIQKVEFTFGSSDGTNEITVSSGTLTEGVWTPAQNEANTNNVKFTVDGTTGQRRIASLKVTYVDDENAVVVVVEEVHIANTAETAYTIAEAVNLINAGQALDETVFVKGVVSQVDKFDDAKKYITYWISADGTTEGQQFELFHGKGIDGADFSSMDDIKVGANVVVKGKLSKFGEVYELIADNQLVSYAEPVFEPVDCTAKVNVNGWQSEHGSVGNYTKDVAQKEQYNGTTAALLGDVLYQIVEGLSNGTYTVELYANASSTGARDTKVIDKLAYSGDLGRVVVYAADVEKTIPAIIQTGVAENNIVKLENVVVTDGTLKMGLRKLLSGTNWHTIQIKSLVQTSDKANADEAAQVTYWKGVATSVCEANVNVGGVVKSALSAAETPAAVQEAIAAFYAARPSYNALVDAIAAAEAAGIDVSEAKAILASVETTAAEAADALHIVKLAVNTAAVAGADAEHGVETNFVVNGTFDVFGVLAPWMTTTGAQNQATANNKQGAFGISGSYFFENWHPSAFTGKMYQIIEDIPNGNYILKIAAFADKLEGNAFVYANTDKVVLTSTEPTAYEVKTIVANNKIEIGLEQPIASAQWMGIDNVSLVYYGSADLTEMVNAYKAALQEAQGIEGVMNRDVQAALTAALAIEVDETNSESLSNATTALAEAAAAAKASVTAYTAAAEKLAAMKSFVESTNAYTADALATYYTQWVEKYETRTLTTEEANALQNPNTETGWRNEVTVDDLLMSVWDVEPMNWTDYHVNTWSNEGDNDGSNFRVPFIEYWNNNDKILAEKTLTATFNNQAPGNYKVTALVRVRLQDGAEAPATGITMQANDGEAVNVCDGEPFTTAGNDHFYVKSVEATGTVGTDGVLTVKFNVAAENSVSWLAFKNIMIEAVPLVPEDIVLTLNEGCELSAALADAVAGKKVASITINLAEGGAYTVSNTLTTGTDFVINGNGATIDASALAEGALVALAAEPTAAFLNGKDYYGIGKVAFNNVKVTGLKNSIFYDNNKKYCVVDFTIDNSVFQLATEAVNNEALISFQQGGIKDLTVNKSTIYGNNTVAKYFVRYNNSARLDRYGFDVSETSTEYMTMTYTDNTFYGVLKSDGQWGNYNAVQGYARAKFDVQNNIWYNCGKDIIRRMAGGRFNGSNPMTFANNAYFNEDKNISASEASYDKSETIYQGELAFEDAAAGKFNVTLTLAEGATAPETIGDPRWTVTIATPRPVIADGIYELTQDMFKVWDGCTATSQPTDAQPNFASGIGSQLKAGDLVYGNSNVVYLQYADATGYDSLAIVGTPGLQVRVLMNRLEVGNGGGDANGGALVEVLVTIAENGVGFLNFAGYEYVHINSLKLGWSSPAGTIQKIELVKGEYPEITGIDNIAAVASRKDGKFLVNGKFVIVRNGREFNAKGQIVK